MIHLVLGGARSGKSSFALAWSEQRLEQAPTRIVQQAERQISRYFVATAEALDAEMRDRIRRHQQERGDSWLLSEVPLKLSEHLQRTARMVLEPQLVLVDCMALWLSNQLFHAPAQSFDLLRNELVEAVSLFQGQSPHDLILVSNEVGLGVVPMGEVSRVFVDQAGWLNQSLATVADRVTFVAAGLPMTLKGGDL